MFIPLYCYKFMLQLLRSYYYLTNNEKCHFKHLENCKIKDFKIYFFFTILWPKLMTKIWIFHLDFVKYINQKYINAQISFSVLYIFVVTLYIKIKHQYLLHTHTKKNNVKYLLYLQFRNARMHFFIICI